MKIVVTGGAGYIGTHVCLELLAAQHEVIVIDNLSRSRRGGLERVERLAGKRIAFVEGDLRDEALVRETLARGQVEAVVHLADLKAVGESAAHPLLYYDNNVGGMVALCRAMEACGIRTMVYSSSATVYGEPRFLPMTEEHPLAPQSPYGHCKLIGESLLADLRRADPRWRVAILRYFNPVGAHVSGMIGEDPRGEPANLVPYVAQVAVGRLPGLTIFGADYDTPDGTGVRDYIHVVDLAEAHRHALDHVSRSAVMTTLNLATGRGSSVLEIVRAFEQASGRPVPFTIAARRAGDVATCYADPGRAERELGWRARRDLAAMCADAWRWQAANPRGYED